MGSVRAGRPDKDFAELHALGVSGDIDEENNQAVDSDMDDPSGNPAVTESLAAAHTQCHVNNKVCTKVF